jgi:hypothetical protein
MSHVDPIGAASDAGRRGGAETRQVVVFACRGFASRAAAPVARTIIARINAGEKLTVSGIKTQIEDATWKAKPAAKQTKLTGRQKTRAAKRAKAELRRPECETEQTQRKARAAEAARMLVESLGDRLPEFLALAQDGGEWWEILRLVREAAKDTQADARVPITRLTPGCAETGEAKDGNQQQCEIEPPLPMALPIITTSPRVTAK